MFPQVPRIHNEQKTASSRKTSQNLDIHMQQIEIGPMSYTKHKNTLNMPSGRTEEPKRQISAEETQGESDMKTVWQ